MEDEFHPAPVEPYQVGFQPSSSSVTEGERGQPALSWAGHPEAWTSSLHPGPMIHEQDWQWLRQKRCVETDSSEEEQEWKMNKAEEAIQITNRQESRASQRGIKRGGGPWFGRGSDERNQLQSEISQAKFRKLAISSV